MYQALLTRRYLTSKVMPLLASLAVVLCTAMVLITWSVMGGFLGRLVNSGRTLVGDVVISWPTSGFAHYEDLITRLEKDPLVAAACPMIETYGQINFESGRSDYVLIKGVDPERFAKVTDFRNSLWWKPVTTPLRKDDLKQDPRLTPIGRGDPKAPENGLWDKLKADGESLSEVDQASQQRRPAVVLGIQVSGLNSRDKSGFFVPRIGIRRDAKGRIDAMDSFLPRDGHVSLSLPTRDSKGMLVDMATRSFPVANEFFCGIYEIDSRTVIADLQTIQRIVRMDAAKRVEGGELEVRINPQTGKEEFVSAGRTVDDPARVTSVLIRGKSDTGAGQAATDLKEAALRVYEGFAAAHPGEVPQAVSIVVRTWEDQNATLIGAVKKETALVLFVFSFISMTAAFLVLAIFWSMISEKTKDIGVLRAIGAARSGIAGLWLAYGLSIGIVGALLGVGLAYLVVTNINPIHEWLGEKLNLYIWDPRIYYFSEIPSHVDPAKAAYVLLGGALSSIIGALIPAIRAAYMDPVRALRFE